MFLLLEQAGGLHMTTCSGSLGFSSVGVLDKSVEPLPKGPRFSGPKAWRRPGVVVVAAL
jgi:hypothetical protein